MEIITSKSNPKILEAIKLKEKKYRQKLGKVLIESPKVIEEAVKAGFEIESLFFNKKNKNTKLISLAKNCYEITDMICEKLSFTKTSQNIFAIIKLPLNKKLELNKLGNNILVLDNLQNPDNLGAILRTALATNFVDILCINCVDCFNDKVIRASMGNVFKASIYDIQYKDLELLEKEYELICADMNGKDVFSIESFPKKKALIIGNEGNGISDFIRQKVKNIVSLKMQNDVESLNASVSAGILMYNLIEKEK